MKTLVLDTHEQARNRRIESSAASCPKDFEPMNQDRASTEISPIRSNESQEIDLSKEKTPC